MLGVHALVCFIFVRQSRDLGHVKFCGMDVHHICVPVHTATTPQPLKPLKCIITVLMVFGSHSFKTQGLTFENKAQRKNANFLYVTLRQATKRKQLFSPINITYTYVWHTHIQTFCSHTHVHTLSHSPIRGTGTLSHSSFCRTGRGHWEGIKESLSDIAGWRACSHDPANRKISHQNGAGTLCLCWHGETSLFYLWE